MLSSGKTPDLKAIPDFESATADKALLFFNAEKLENNFKINLEEANLPTIVESTLFKISTGNAGFELTKPSNFFCFSLTSFNLLEALVSNVVAVVKLVICCAIFS